MGGPAAGMRQGNPGATMGDSRMIDMQSPMEMRRAAAQQRRAQAEARRLAAQGNAADEAAFGQATAERAKTLKDADLEARKAFGTEQAALAKAKGDATAGDDVDDDDVEADVDEGEPRASADQSAFGRQTAERAKTLKDADLEARKAFGTEQAALAKAKGDATAGDDVDDDDVEADVDEGEPRASAEQSAFGRQTAERAKTLKDADTETRKGFGPAQSALARSRAEAARDAREDDDEDGDGDE